MNIAIIGAGNVGRALGTGWRKAGHEVTLGVRDPAGSRATELEQQGFAIAPPKDAAARAEVIVLAVPWGAVRATLESLGALAGKILIDATNPLTSDMSLALGHTGSGGETVARLAPGARVVKAFNTTGANNMVDSRYANGKLVMLVAGDDPEAKAGVISLANDLGFEAVDTGPLAMSRYLEPMAMVWIKLALAQKLGRNFGFALLRKG
jgi:8-hydroxy-5-deazaflavin:NADPH oxidoreductase